MAGTKAGAWYGTIIQDPATEGQVGVSDLVKAIRSGTVSGGVNPLNQLPDQGVVTRRTPGSSPLNGLADPTVTDPRDAHIEFRAVSKHFGGVQALSDINVRVAAGTVHALVGENGAGKSTLSKICGGVLSPDSGQVLVDGAPVTFRSPRDALTQGIATIAQELALVPGLTVAQNVFLGSEAAPRRFHPSPGAGPTLR